MVVDLKKEDDMSGIARIIISRFPIVIALNVVLLWAVWVPLQAQAEPRQHIRMAGPHQHGRAMRDFVGHSLRGLLRHQTDLGLSGEQIAKIRALSTDYAKTRIKTEADVKLAEVEVRSLVRDEKADLSTIESALKKSEGSHTALRLEGVKTLRAAAAVLTPEQRAKWRADMTEGHRSAMRHAEHPMGGEASNPREG
jgi:Spy/CpxP family protein refolding chaperone